MEEDKRVQSRLMGAAGTLMELSAILMAWLNRWGWAVIFAILGLWMLTYAHHRD